MTAQTLRSPLNNMPVILNGPLVRLGTFEDVRCRYAERTIVEIGFSLRVSSERLASFAGRFWPSDTSRQALVRCSYAFIAPSTDGRRLPQLHPDLHESRLESWVDIGDSRASRTNADLRSMSERPPGAGIHMRRLGSPRVNRLVDLGLGIEGRVPSRVLESFDYEVVDFADRSRRRSGSDMPVGASLTHFLPRRITVVYDAAERASNSFVSALLESVQELDDPPGDTLATEADQVLNAEVRAILLQVLKSIGTPDAQSAAALLEQLEFSTAQFVASYRTLRPDYRRQLAKALADRRDDLLRAVRVTQFGLKAAEHRQLPPVIRDSSLAIRDFFVTSVRYLGPIRTAPRTVYPLVGGSESWDVGVSGEHTAAVLDLYSEAKVPHLPPERFVADRNLAGQTEVNLLQAVNEWLAFLGVGSEAISVSIGRLGYELRSEFDLTQVGIGVSQVLPVLVMALVAPSGATLLFEQPEVHLNPKAQTRLADFFVAMARLGKQCVVETHSEHLVNRLRYWAAATSEPTMADSIALYFVEQIDRQSQYRRVIVNEYGVLEEWPVGFFDETENSAASILEAGIRKRRSRPGNNQNA